MDGSMGDGFQFCSIQCDCHYDRVVVCCCSRQLRVRSVESMMIFYFSITKTALFSWFIDVIKGQYNKQLVTQLLLFFS